MGSCFYLLGHHYMCTTFELYLFFGILTFCCGMDDSKIGEPLVLFGWTVINEVVLMVKLVKVCEAKNIRDHVDQVLELMRRAETGNPLLPYT